MPHRGRANTFVSHVLPSLPSEVSRGRKDGKMKVPRLHYVSRFVYIERFENSISNRGHGFSTFNTYHQISKPSLKQTVKNFNCPSYTPHFTFKRDRRKTNPQTPFKQPVLYTRRPRPKLPWHQLKPGNGSQNKWSTKPKISHLREARLARR